MATESVNHETDESVKTLHKQHTLSPDILRDEAWINRRINNSLRRGHSSVVTYDDIEELRACFELGFGFDSFDDINPKLFSTLPALDMYLKSQSYNLDTLFSSDADLEKAATSPCLIIEPGEDSDTVKMKLKEWARTVASSLRQLYPYQESGDKFRAEILNPELNLEQVSRNRN